LYVLAQFPLSLHYLRSLTAHNYLSHGEKLSFNDQLLDSINVKGNRFFTEFLYPIGLRFHALHHLFPSMPYHNLGIAHRRLMTQLPEDSLYRRLEYPSFWSVIRELMENSRGASPQQDSKSFQQAA
jgi:fatty acid desaturase